MQLANALLERSKHPDIRRLEPPRHMGGDGAEVQSAQTQLSEHLGRHMDGAHVHAEDAVPVGRHPVDGVSQVTEHHAEPPGVQPG